MSEIDDRLREELGALLDGALDEERAAELRARLETDDLLRKEYDELRRAVAAVRELPRPRAPAELHARVRSALAPPAGRVFFLRRALAAAAVVAVALTATLLSTRGDETEPPSVFEEARRPEPQSPQAPVADQEEASARKLGAKAAESVEADEEEADDIGLVMRDERKDDAPKRRMRESLKKEAAQPEAEMARERREGTPKDAGEVGGRATTAQVYSLFAAVENGKALTVPDRILYFAELNQLTDQKATAHLAAVQAEAIQLDFGKAASRGMLAGTPPPIASVIVSDLDEATQMYNFLRGRYPVTGKAGPAVAETRPQVALLTADLELTPQEWRQVGPWLQVMSVAKKPGPRAGLRVAEEKTRQAKGGEKKKAPAESAAADAGVGGGAKTKQKVRIQIRYAPPEKKKDK